MQLDFFEGNRVITPLFRTVAATGSRPGRVDSSNIGISFVNYCIFTNNLNS